MQESGWPGWPCLYLRGVARRGEPITLGNVGGHVRSADQTGNRTLHLTRTLLPHPIETIVLRVGEHLDITSVACTHYVQPVTVINVIHNAAANGKAQNVVAGRANTASKQASSEWGNTLESRNRQRAASVTDSVVGGG